MYCTFFPNSGWIGEGQEAKTLVLQSHGSRFGRLCGQRSHVNDVARIARAEAPNRKLPDLPTPAYFPLKRGGRFSMNARRPSV
jgi:hypothetical protein